MAKQNKPAAPKKAPKADKANKPAAPKPAVISPVKKKCITVDDITPPAEPKKKTAELITVAEMKLAEKKPKKLQPIVVDDIPQVKADNEARKAAADKAKAKEAKKKGSEIITDDLIDESGA
jgi:hypothetical protein